MPPFKDELDIAAARRLARELAAAWPGFPTRRFTNGLNRALEPLELLARRDAIAERLVYAMPNRFADAADILYHALESTTFTGWIVEPCNAYVARAGIDDPDTALPLLAALTPRWSSEFAIRPFIERHPARTYAYLYEWLANGDEHVRRLVSEGTRPRLPWAPQLRGLIADPTLNLPLLHALAGDPAPYVRRSVANHLNDVSKDHPDLALEIAERWAPQGDGHMWTVRHGLRTLVKRGNSRALRIVGAAVDATVELVRLSIDRDHVRVGDAVTIELILSTPADSAAVNAIVDYRVHYIGADGNPKAPKVFKLTRRRLVPGKPVKITRAHRFEDVSIRRIHPGCHRIDVQVNGRVLGGVDVNVADAGRIDGGPSTKSRSS
ncbi:MAG: DNA alkylation repair protein [Acidimicrobiales bacterium]